jgi:hemolysin III
MLMLSVGDEMFLACLIYGFTLIALYAASTSYHWSTAIHKKRKLKTLDHSCIYLLIAGTYTPFSLGPLRDAEGPWLIAIEWGMALIGIIIEVVLIKRYRLLSVTSYLIMGWLILFSLPTLAEVLSSEAYWWLIGGGVAYTLGTLFYVWERLPYNHAIWHGFVLMGSVCHWSSVWNIVQPTL